MMLQIAICDTIEHSRNQISDFCKKFFSDKYINYEIKEYTSGESLLVQDFPDVLFLEIEMKVIDGILVKEILHKMNAATKIVFISNQVEKMKEAFGKNVYAFLEKTVNYEIFSDYMKCLMRDIEVENNHFFCKHHNEIQRILMRDVLYLQAYGKYTKVFIRGENDYRLSDKSFGNWYLDMENQGFLCCHKSYLVNLGYIEKVEKEIVLLGGKRIPFSNIYKKEFFESYKNYMDKFKRIPEDISQEICFCEEIDK